MITGTIEAGTHHEQQARHRHELSTAQTNDVRRHMTGREADCKSRNGRRAPRASGPPATDIRACSKKRSSAEP
ncbi:hypothetical protein GCM10027405_20710 [Arthrobacter alkaliphilus]